MSQNSSMDLKNKVVLLTGASIGTGIGKGIGKAFLQGISGTQYLIQKDRYDVSISLFQNRNYLGILE